MSLHFTCSSCQHTYVASRPAVCPVCKIPLVATPSASAPAAAAGLPASFARWCAAAGGVVVLLVVAGVLAIAALPRSGQATDNENQRTQVVDAIAPQKSAESEEPRSPGPPLELSPPADPPRDPEPGQFFPPAQSNIPPSAPIQGPDDDKKQKNPPLSKPPQSAPTRLKRLHQFDAEELRKQLLLVPEVALDAVPNTAANLVTFAARRRLDGEPYLGPAHLIGERLDLACLPLQTGMDCVLGKEPAEELQAMSRKLRVAIEACIPTGSGDPRPEPERLRKRLLDKDGGWLKPEAVRCMRQMLNAENRQVRQVMVEVMAKIRDRIATETLAMTALTDLSPEVREAAVLALKDRPADDYRPLLLGGLRYPWNAVVAHAAEAVTALDGKQAAPALVQALLTADPNLPETFQQGKQKLHVVRELVRVNHLANCVLCHAPSFDRADLVRGAVPIPGQPLPGPASTPQYYESGESFVRADITYLRQHFSVMQPVLRAGQWPSNQRFDYLVRLRPITTKKELEQAEALKLKTMTPQKEVLRRAVKELTGQDPGETPEDWRKLASSGAPDKDLDTSRQKLIEKEWGPFLPERLLKAHGAR